MMFAAQQVQQVHYCEIHNFAVVHTSNIRGECFVLKASQLQSLIFMKRQTLHYAHVDLQTNWLMQIISSNNIILH
jgi:hypothetical protein